MPTSSDSPTERYTIYVDRTYMVGEFAVRITQRGHPQHGEAGATWMATTYIPYREGEDARAHLTIGAASSALGAVLALGTSVQDKAEVILHLTPYGPDGFMTPLFATLNALASGLHSLAWGTVAGWPEGVDAHPGHPTFEEVTGAEGLPHRWEA